MTPAPESASEPDHRRIVVGVDGSAESHAALEWAVREAQHTGDEVDAVLAYDSGLAWIDVGSEYQSVIVKHSADHARTQLDLMLATMRPDGQWPVAVHPLAVAGSPAEVLVEIARDADLLVVGSHGQRCLHRVAPRIDQPAVCRAQLLRGGRRARTTRQP